MVEDQASRYTATAEIAVALCKQMMEVVGLPEHYAEADSFGFGYIVDSDRPEVRIMVDWEDKRVLQMVNAGLTAEGWQVEQFDNGGDDRWIDAMRSNLGKLQFAAAVRRSPPTTWH